MKAVHRGKVEIIVCYKLDRLGRSLAHLAAMIAEFTAHNVALVVPEQGIDTSTANPAARLHLNVLGAVAEFDREIIRERVNDGIAAAKARGVRFGHPATLDAHRVDIVALREQGLSCRKVAEQLDVPIGSVFQVVRESRLANLEKVA